MAVLYIDRLKNNFQGVEPHVSLSNTNENWFPQFSLGRITTKRLDDFQISKQLRIKNAAMKFMPNVPKIFTIGLRLDSEDNDRGKDERCWNIDGFKSLLKRYFNFILRYQNLFCASWTSVPKGSIDQWSYSFVSVKCTSSECLNNLKKKCSKLKKSDLVIFHHEDNQSSIELLPKLQFPSNDTDELKLDDNEYPKCETQENEDNENSKIHNKQSICTMTMPMECLSFRENDRNNCYEDCFVKTKRNVYVQTSERNILRSKKVKRQDSSDQKENFTAISNNSSCNDIETIFTSNQENFDNNISKTNLEFLKERYVPGSSLKRQNGRKLERKSKTDKSPSKRNESRLYEPISTKENVSYLKNNMESNVDNCKKKFAKSKKIERKETSLDRTVPKFSKVKRNTNRNFPTFYCHTEDKIQTKTLMSKENENCGIRKILGRKIENNTDFSNTRYANNSNYLTNNGDIIVENSVWIQPRNSLTEINNTSSNYLIENKSSELIILGNVKKRLEENYDDYFSLNDLDFENDLFLDAEEHFDSVENSTYNSDITVRSCSSLENLKGTRSMLLTTSVTEHQEIKQDLTKQSRLTSLTCKSSLQISNSEINSTQSNQYISLKESESSPSSSMEYRTASNISLTNFQPSRNNSISMLFQSCSLEPDRSITPNERNYFQNDNSFAEDEIFQGTREYLDQSLINSYTVCCYQRNSTPKFSSSTRLVTESLDSGILTDCSRDRFRIRSSERFRRKNRKEGKKDEEKYFMRKMDLFPTYDFNTDSSYSDESLNRRVDVAVNKFTEKLILTERRARSKLNRMENPVTHRQERKKRKKGPQVKSVPDCYSKRNSAYTIESPRFHDDDWLISSSTPPLLSFSDSEIDHI